MKMKLALALVFAGFVAAGCNEIPQDAVKPFAAGDQAKTHGDALAERTRLQNEYEKTGGAPPR